MFRRYVNPKIDELKTSIESLSSQNKLITEETTNLEKNNETIEKLSKQIKSNVTELNKTIEDPERFKCLSETFKKLICSILERFVEEICKEVKSFEEELNQIITNSRGRILHEVGILTNKIEKHVQSTKNQLERYINKTDELDSYISNKRNLIPPLSNYLVKAQSILNKMEELKHTKWELTNEEIIRYNSPFNAGFVAGLKKFRGKLNAFLFHKIYGLDSLQGRIKKLTEFLNDVLFLDEANDIMNRSGSLDFQAEGRRYDQELRSLRDSTIRAFALADKISDLRRKVRLLNPFEKLFKEIGDLKASMTPIRKYIIPGLESFVDNLEYTVTTKEDIVNFVKGMENGTHKTIRKLHNSQKIIKFLQVVEDKLTSLRGVPDANLDRIDEHISKLKYWIVDANSTYKFIRNSFRENIGQTVQIDRHDDIRSGPVRIKEYIGKVVPKLIKHVEQEIDLLEIIVEINEQLDAIKSAGKQLSSENGTSQEACVEDSLEYLKKIDKTLDQVYMSTNSALTKMKEIHGKNQQKFNGTNIQSSVNQINKIPDEILKLQSEVRYNKVLLNVAKSVNETLNGIEVKAKELKWIGFCLEYIRRRIEDIIREYDHINSNICALSCSTRDINDLNMFKGNIKDLKNFLGRLNRNIKWMNRIKEWLEESTSEIQRYQEVLSEIHWRIEQITAQLMPFLALTGSNGSTSGGQSSCGEGTIYSSINNVIKCMKFTILRIIKLMRCVSGVQYSICCTKQKLGCFVSSLETRARWIGEGVKEVECSIESVIVCFLKCSNKSITNNTIKSTKGMLTRGNQVYNNELAKPLLRCLENIGCQYST